MTKNLIASGVYDAGIGGRGAKTVGVCINTAETRGKPSRLNHGVG